MIRKELKRDGQNILRMCTSMIDYKKRYRVTLLKRIRNNKAPDAKAVVNKFFKYGGYKERNKLLKIMNMIFEKGELPSDFRKTLIESLYRKGHMRECGNYKGYSLVSGSNKLLNMMVIF